MKWDSFKSARMMRHRAVVSVLLVCACGAVNILLYTLGGTRSKQDLARSEEGRIELISGSKELATSQRVKSSWSGHTTIKVDPTENRLFQFLINNVSVCSHPNKWDLVVVVISDVRNVHRRQAIRNTWASVASVHNSLVLFLLGNNSAEVDQNQVLKEAELYNDVIQVDCRDSYDLLTYKVIAMLQWLTDYCANSVAYLKSDDDSFINIANAVPLITSQQSNRWFLCHVFTGARPDRNINAKWYTSYDEYRDSVFPTYCSGVAYAFSSTVLSDLYYSTLKTDFLRMEDVFITGLAAKSLNVRHIHSWKFNFSKIKPTGCAYSDVISGHEVTLRQMEVIFSQLMSKEIDCKTNENLTVKKAKEIFP